VRATGDKHVKPRRDGRTYDSMWKGAIRSKPDGVTITSYNEWHEGTQIEPASATPPGNAAKLSYSSYDGAYGTRGKAAQRAYLDRTRFWVRAFVRSERPEEQLPSG
jgi:glycoprotein endo-alpha-1,2-mannosidase